MSFASAFSGEDARKHAANTAGETERLAKEQAAQGRLDYTTANQYRNDYLSPMLKTLYQGANNYDPFGTVNNAPALFQYRHANENAYNDAVNNTYNDFSSRGLGTGPSSGLNQTIGNIRSDEASNFGNFRNNMFMQNIAEQQRRQEAFAPMVAGISGNIEGQGSTNIGSGMGALGGLTGMYQSSADKAAANIGQIAGTIAGLPALGRSQNPDAGNNMTGTNQPGASIGPPGGFTTGLGPGGGAINNAFLQSTPGSTGGLATRSVAPNSYDRNAIKRFK